MQFHPDKCQVLSINNKRKSIISNYTLHNHILATVRPTQLQIILLETTCWKFNQISRQSPGIPATELTNKFCKSKTTTISNLCLPNYITLVHSAGPLGLPNIPTAATGNGHSDGQPVLSAIATVRHPALPTWWLVWEPLINRRNAFRMFMVYKTHSGLVAIHATHHITPRQYHTWYCIPH